jgi:hypothetical protein
VGQTLCGAAFFRLNDTFEIVALKMSIAKLYELMADFLVR